MRQSMHSHLTFTKSFPKCCNLFFLTTDPKKKKKRNKEIQSRWVSWEQLGPKESLNRLRPSTNQWLLNLQYTDRKTRLLLVIIVEKFSTFNFQTPKRSWIKSKCTFGPCKYSPLLYTSKFKKQMGYLKDNIVVQTRVSKYLTYSL